MSISATETKMPKCFIVWIDGRVDGWVDGRMGGDFVPPSIFSFLSMIKSMMF